MLFEEAASFKKTATLRLSIMDMGYISKQHAVPAARVGYTGYRQQGSIGGGKTHRHR